jgi:hypothetical protein
MRLSRSAGTGPVVDASQITLGTAGKGGPGGNSNLKVAQRANGVAAPMQKFP